MDLGMLLIRLVVGLTLVAHGGQKLFGWFGGHGIAGTGQFFESLGLRNGRVQAVLAGLAEAGGGLLLALGLLTPLGAAAIIAVMVVAIATVHLPKGFFVTGGGYEYNLVLALVAAGIAFTGPGPLSLDAALGIDWARWWGPAALVLGALGGLAVVATRRRRAAGDSSVTSG
jgi:putative oxidoreductase